MPTRRGPALKKLRYYISQLPPENIFPHKKINAATRGVIDHKSLREGLAATIEDVQQKILASYLNMKRLRGEQGL